VKVDFAFLAEAASAPPDGKFYVIGGGVNRVASPSFPVVTNLGACVSNRAST
jgi:hypothetical protein